MRRAAKIDNTHAECVDALRAARCSVFSTAPLGRDFPDAVVSYRGFTALAEFKSPGGRLTGGQLEFAANWQGAVIVAYSGPEAVEKFFQAWAADRLQAAWMDQATEA